MLPHALGLVSAQAEYDEDREEYHHLQAGVFTLVSAIVANASQLITCHVFSSCHYIRGLCFIIHKLACNIFPSHNDSGRSMSMFGRNVILM